LLAFLVVRSFNRIGALLSSSTFNAGDHAYPVLIGFAEMCSFVFLTDRFANNRFFVVWAISLSGAALFSGLLIHNRIRQIEPARDYAEDAQDFVGAYVAWHRQGRWGALAWSAVSLLCAIGAALAAWSGWETAATVTVAVLATATFALALNGLSFSGTIFNRFSRLLR
jgi:hypothetical protein